MKALDQFRKPDPVLNRKRAVLLALALFPIGAIVGAACKALDATEFLGGLTSRIALWILIGAAMSVRADTPARASLYCLSAFLGMLAGYYAWAELMGLYWKASFARFWLGVALASTACGYLCWYAHGKGWFSAAMRWGTVAFDVLATVVLFKRVRVADALLIALTGLLLFARRKEMKKG